MNYVEVEDKNDETSWTLWRRLKAQETLQRSGTAVPIRSQTHPHLRLFIHGGGRGACRLLGRKR